MIYTEGRFSRIDYFSFKVLFDLFDSQYLVLKTKLFHLLHINENEFDTFSEKQFFDCRKYKWNITIKGQPSESARRSDGRNYYCVVLTGDSCEYLRDCGTSFVEIIDYINYLNNLVLINDNGKSVFCKYEEVDDFNKMISLIGAEVSRFDIAVDLVNNKFFTLDELKKKILNKYYVSRFKARLDVINRVNYQVQETLLKGWQSDEVDFNINATKKGFSAIWGSKASLQLNIYDKVAEIYAKTRELIPASEIIRFELRFGTNKANYNYQELYQYLVENKLDVYIGNLLFNTIRFLDISKEQYKKYSQSCNLDKAKTWKPYQEFIDYLRQGEYCDIKMGSKMKYPENNKLDKNLDWLSSSVYSALTKVACLTSNDELLKIVFREAILKSFQKGKINNDFNFTLNEFGKDYDLREMNLLERWNLAREKYISLGGNYTDFKMPYSVWESNFKNLVSKDCGFISRQEEY